MDDSDSSLNRAPVADNQMPAPPIPQDSLRQRTDEHNFTQEATKAWMPWLSGEDDINTSMYRKESLLQRTAEHNFTQEVPKRMDALVKRFREELERPMQ